MKSWGPPRRPGWPSSSDGPSVSVVIASSGRLFWNDQPLEDAALPERLARAAEATPQPELHLRADRDTRYQKLAEVMALAREAGIEKMGFITVPQTSPAAR